MTPRASPGSSTSAAVELTLTRCARATSNTRASYGSISIPAPEWPGRRAPVALEVKPCSKSSASRLPEDQRLARHARERAHPAALRPFTEVRRAALALRARSSAACPTLATSKWWKEERHGVFLDYNQNAKDRTTCSAFSVRPLPDARVSAPLTWDEVPDCQPADFTMFTMPERFRATGDPHAPMDETRGLARSAAGAGGAERSAGLGDAPGLRTSQDER